MESPNATTFVRLRQSKLPLADTDHDIRGRKVVDREGEELGEVKSVFVDEEERNIRLLELEGGGVLGLGDETRLVPVEAIDSVSTDAVRVGPTRQHALGAPTHDPQLSEREYLGALYGYYGYPN